MRIDNSINMLDTMYPAHMWMKDNEQFTLPDFIQYGSIYGYSFGESELVIDGKKHNLEKGQYFAFAVKKSVTGNAKNKIFLVSRLGYQVQSQIGWVEEKGRLSYIDGCSDSLLVYPSRLGDASLNLLYFPPGIDQSFHRHPSIRLGCVIDGSGLSSHGEITKPQETVLSTGLGFCLEEQENHRFRTTTSSMTVIAFHPDGDWGPTDHNHTMLNRTYLTK